MTSDSASPTANDGLAPESASGGTPAHGSTPPAGATDSADDAPASARPPDGDRLAYDGAAGAAMNIAVSNSLLTLATLGVYRFWGKTRVRRYLWEPGLVPRRPCRVHRHRARAPPRLHRGDRRARVPRRLAHRARDCPGHRPPVLLDRAGRVFGGAPVPRLRGRVPGKAVSPEPYRVARHPLRPRRVESGATRCSPSGGPR